MPATTLPRVAADGPLAEAVALLLADRVELLPWCVLEEDGLTALDGIYTYGHPELGERQLAKTQGVRVISNYGVGVDHIDVLAAAARGIPVGNTPGILDGATADMAFALLLAAARRLPEGDRYARSAAFTTYDPGLMLGHEVHGQTLGILGMGRIGLRVAKRALGFEMRVLYHNRRRREKEEQQLGLQYADFDELLSESDFVVLTLPLTPETTHLIGAAELAKMKASAILVNVARGGVIDTSALAAALAEKKIAAAALDVTEPEPLPREHALLQMDNVVIAPHLGSATKQTRQLMAERSAENLLAGLNGEPLPYAVGGGEGS